MFINLSIEMIKEFELTRLIEKQDPRRPGPDYYKDCIQFNWVDALVDKHKNSLSNK